MVTMVTVLPELRRGVGVATQGVCVWGGRGRGVPPWGRGSEEQRGDPAVLPATVSWYTATKTHNKTYCDVVKLQGNIN